jgi:3-phosphoshikimate 1-carboxyvinyltransferase
LRLLGANIEALPDGFIVEGPTRLKGAAVSSHGDHRLAMSLAIAALAADGVTTVDDTACIADSFPGFEQALAALGVGL